MIALIPLAGDGLRFKNEGYKVPKPLLKVSGKPMVVEAAKALPSADEYIFICRYFHLTEYFLDQAIGDYFPDSLLISVDKVTEGQASTCLMAKEYINNEKPLVIGASDNGMIYDTQKFWEATEGADCVVFTFSGQRNVTENPKHYAYVTVDDKGWATKVSVKQPISANPKNDQTVIGAFYFKQGSYFVEAAEKMIAYNRRVNNEFYVDEVINVLIEEGYKVRPFQIDHYLCWGTPADYQTYKYWESYFDLSPDHPFKINSEF